jgi:hypothetical protein
MSPLYYYIMVGVVIKHMGEGHKEENDNENLSRMQHDNLQVETQRRLNPKNKSVTKAFKGEK